MNRRRVRPRWNGFLDRENQRVRFLEVGPEKIPRRDRGLFGWRMAQMAAPQNQRTLFTEDGDQAGGMRVVEHDHIARRDHRREPPCIAFRYRHVVLPVGIRQWCDVGVMALQHRKHAGRDVAEF